MRNAFVAFVAGFLATLGFHQPVLWLLNALGVVQRAPYAMEPTPPFGVPAVISLAFWGGVWGVLLWFVLRRARHSLLMWTIFGAIAPTLVAATLVRSLKGQPVPDNAMAMLAIGLLINGMWGLGTGVLLRVIPGTASPASPADRS